MTLVYFAGGGWDAIAGTDRQLVEALGRRTPVLWVDPPMSWIGRRRRGVTARRLSEAAPGVTRLHTSAPPGVSRPGVRAVARRMLRVQVRRALRGAVPAAVVVTAPEPLLPGWPGAVRIYYATDDFVAGAALLGMTPGYARRVQRANLRAADHVLAVSADLAAALGPGAQVLANGCNPERYARVEDLAPAPEVSLPRPVAGVVGQLNERLDLGLLEAVAGAGHSLLLIGPRYEREAGTRRRLDALLGRPGVQWVGRVPAERLPEYLAAVDVGLTPYADTPFNRASFPLKTLEYLAAGRPVVSTDLPSARWLATDLIDLASGPQEFAALVGGRLAQPFCPARAAQRRAFAARHSWQERAGELLRRVGEPA